MFESFKAILQSRKAVRKSRYASNLKQGTTLPLAHVSPYSFKDTLNYAAGLLLGDYASSNACQAAMPGRSLVDHVVGVSEGRLNPVAEASATGSLRFCVVGDVMVSKSGQPIQLSQKLIESIGNSDLFIINVESPVTFETALNQRDSLNFTMSKTYLSHFVAQLKDYNPNLTIIYDIANNHALDGGECRHGHVAEKAIEAVDSDNFPLLRTVAAIREMDSSAVIIGAHLAEEEYRAIACDDGETVNCYAEPLAVVEKNGIRCGFIGFTDVLNHNAYSWKKRVVRTEDLPDLKALKEENKLDQLYLIGHGNLEQCIYPKKAWRHKMLQFLSEGADGIFGHGPHVPLPNEVISVQGRDKFIAHSLGNLYGPTKLKNTGLNSLAKYTVYPDKSSAFEMLPIEAVHNEEGQPFVRTVEDETDYPHLLARYERLFPLAEMPETFAPLASIDEKILSSAEIAFIKQLHVLKSEANRLIENNQPHASEQLDKLYNKLCYAFSAFHHNKQKEDAYETFKASSLTAIQKADNQLSQHHQTQKILLNLTLAVMTLGIGYLAAISINKIATGHFTFFNRHNLQNRLEDLQEDITSDDLNCSLLALPSEAELPPL